MLGFIQVYQFAIEITVTLGAVVDVARYSAFSLINFLMVNSLMLTHYGDGLDNSCSSKICITEVVVGTWSNCCNRPCHRILTLGVVVQLVGYWN